MDLQVKRGTLEREHIGGPAGTWRPEGRTDLIFRKVGEEWLLFDPESQEIHVLNLSAALIWSFCDGRHTADEIAARVGEAFAAGRRPEVEREAAAPAGGEETGASTEVREPNAEAETGAPKETREPGTGNGPDGVTPGQPVAPPDPGPVHPVQETLERFRSLALFTSGPAKGGSRRPGADPGDP